MQNNLFEFESPADEFKFPLFAVTRKLFNALNDVAPKLGRKKYEECERIAHEIQMEAAVPRCQRCHNQMSPQYFEKKITWWSCDDCAAAADLGACQKTADEEKSV